MGGTSVVHVAVSVDAISLGILLRYCWGNVAGDVCEVLLKLWGSVAGDDGKPFG